MSTIDPAEFYKWYLIFSKSAPPIPPSDLYVLKAGDTMTGGLVTPTLSTAGLQASAVSFLRQTLTTTDATPEILAGITILENEVYAVEITIIGRIANTAQAAIAKYIITVRRQTGGNITLVNETMIQNVSTSAATISYALDTGDQTLNFIVTGEAAQTYEWSADYTVRNI
jgi:hypothetical protein